MDAFDKFFDERMDGKYDSVEAKAAKLAEVENERGECWRAISQYLRDSMATRIMVDQGYLYDGRWYKPENDSPAGGAAGESK